MGINPVSGARKAVAVWETTKALWANVPGLEWEEIFTTRANHAFDHVKQLDVNAYDGIVIVSGDGLVHEVFNALSQHPDAGQALTIPVGHIPGGSGNGLATSILKASGECYGVLDAAFLIAKGGSQPIDLMSVRTPETEPRTSFLSLSAALISDIDIESEALRCIGPARFTVWAL